MRHVVPLLTALLLAGCISGGGESPLPSVRHTPGGATVHDHAEWIQQRAHLLEVLLREQYGSVPSRPEIRVEKTEHQTRRLQGFDGKAMLGTAELVFGPEDALRMRVGLWTRADAREPMPCVLAIEPVWWEAPFVTSGIAAKLLAAGYAFAGFDHNALASYEDPAQRAAHDAYPSATWGTVAAAAWGASITLDWLETLERVERGKVAIWGHSRRGKSAILAGAMDTRFAAVLPHQSGMAGTALYRVRGAGAQRLEQLLEQYWLTPKAFTYIGREDEMPFDQHWLHALVAPRPLFIDVGREDAWGNPPGEMAAVEAARPIYAWLGAPGALEIDVGAQGHVDANAPDSGEWEQVIGFLDRQWQR